MISSRYKFLIAVGLIILLGGWSYLISRIYYYSKIDDAQKADAIVVLGASQWNGQPSPVFAARLDHAYDLYNKNFSQKIILTGGIGKSDQLPEATVGKNYLIEKGIKADNIFIEEKSKTSKQNLDEAAKILKEQNLNSVILVSDGFHMMRIKKMANDFGIKSYASPVKDGSINKNKLVRFKYCVRESLVYILYLIFGI